MIHQDNPLQGSCSLLSSFYQARKERERPNFNFRVILLQFSSHLRSKKRVTYCLSRLRLIALDCRPKLDEVAYMIG